MQGNEILGVYNWRLAPHFSQLQRFSSRTCRLRRQLLGFGGWLS